MHHLYLWNSQTCTWTVAKTIHSVEKWSILLPNVLIFLVGCVEPIGHCCCHLIRNNLSFFFFVQVFYSYSSHKFGLNFEQLSSNFVHRPNPSTAAKSPKYSLL